MARKNNEKDNGNKIPTKQPSSNKQSRITLFFSRLHPDARKSILAIGCLGIAIILILAIFESAGPAGDFIYNIFNTLFGWGYFLLPVGLLGLAVLLLIGEQEVFMSVIAVGAVVCVFSTLGLVQLILGDHGGWLGHIFASFEVPFGHTAATIINIILFSMSVIIMLNTPISIPFPLRRKKEDQKQVVVEVAKESEVAEESKEKEPAKSESVISASKEQEESKRKRITAPKKFADYVPPPLSLLNANVEKPTTGDLRANANIIKRTLDSFGVTVEMGEINIGPKVTRYTLKPAEGVKLSRLTALSSDLALALAAHPIRIEAPIPGKSLVGIEVPNKAAAIVRLGNLMSYADFQSTGPLGIVLGRDVTGDPLFANIEKMPHLMIAGATGSGKSIFIHSLIVSLLYKNSPAMLKLALIDPKRVELSIYGGLPHLITPVITENKKAMGVFRWVIKEMERRYEMLSAEGRRDVTSYNSKNPEDPLPYIIVVVDELADLMSTYGREVEGSIIRLAQMARATGIHLVLSTQRPSVEVITGLIKANITNRVALQVASQVDSRTILDTSGAEKLLGGGDLLFISQEISKPKRIQGAYLTEDEIHAVVDFIREHNKSEPSTDAPLISEMEAAKPLNNFDEYLEDEEDELYNEAVEQVRSAQKASASLLQRRLKVGYARAARLLDLMEQNGLIGPGEGAKPREVYLEKLPQE